MQHRYGARVVLYHALRSHTAENVFLNSSISDNYQKGEDALIDALLLSRCSHLLKPHSALSETAVYFSPNASLHFHTEEMQYSHEDTATCDNRPHKVDDGKPVDWDALMVTLQQALRAPEPRTSLPTSDGANGGARR